MDTKIFSNISYIPKTIQKNNNISFSGSVASKTVSTGGIEKFLSALGSVFKADVDNAPLNLKKLFLDNNFSVNNHGQFYKKLSSEQLANIKRRFGDKSEFVKDFFKPISQETQKQFKEFLSIGDNFKFAKNNFDEMYILFSSMNESMKSYKSTIEFFKQNPQYASFLQNLAQNPVKSSNVFDTIAKYKYKGDAIINNALRTHNTSSPDINKQVSTISSFIDTQKIKNPTRLYRGEGIEKLRKVKLKNGQTINLAAMMESAKGDNNKINKIREFVLDNKIQTHDSGFMSTTMDRKIALDFASPKPNQPKNTPKILWIFDTKPNTKGAYLDPLNLNGSLSFEKEILLQKNTDITVKDINFKDGLWYLKAEVSN